MTSKNYSPIAQHLSAALLACALLSGCVAAPRQQALVADDEQAQCREVFRNVDQAVARAQVADGMTARVAGFPYLRVNRFLASYAREDMNEARFADWMNRMVSLGSQAYAVELANLPADRAEELAHALWNIDARYAWLRPAVAECTQRLAVLDAADRGRRLALREAAKVADDYSTWQRIAGLYWITRIPFAAGVGRWHEETRATYARPLEALPVAGRLQAYLPPSSPAGVRLTGVLERASANPLAIPDPQRDDLEALFRAHAPAFVVDTATEADEPGELGFGGADGTPQVVSRRPVVYRRASHTRYEGRALLQLNYAIWFPARPKGAGWDLLGGQLDGVLWRVTLAPDGSPWIYDSIHLCGCYHIFFPTPRAVPKAQPETLDEWAFVPQTAPPAAPGAGVTLRLEAGTHYVQRVVTSAALAGPALEYIFADDDTLRSLPLPNGGRRSAFRPDGIVSGSERGERWLFWPMGVAEAGAMRQWGRHATAFVGRRHFDDPDLLERYFTLGDQ